jgi:opacity protein-like surface antigen
VDAEVDSERFMGGQVRLGLSRRTAIELSLDVRTETNEAATLRVREYPIQASFLLYPVRSVLSPYVLGGGGWYAQRIETLLDDEVQASETTRDFGWHAGFGGELQLGRHLGIHADYRYTFLDFGDDDEPGGEPAGANGFSRLVSFLPSHKGSMWTAGLTVYF